MPSEFDQLILELEKVQSGQSSSSMMQKAIPGAPTLPAVDIRAINERIGRAQTALRKLPPLQPVPKITDRWPAFFKSLENLNADFGARVAAGKVTAVQAATLEASLHHLTDKAVELYKRETR
jgi:hypothetical protein